MNHNNLLPQSFIDPTQMTDGEFRIALLADQFNLVGSAQQMPELLIAADYLKDFLHVGIHRNPAPSTGNFKVDRLLRQAQKQTEPAAGIHYMRKSNGIPDAALSGIFGLAGPEDVLIPENQFGNCVVPTRKKNRGESNKEFNARHIREIDAYDECLRIRNNVRAINAKIAPSSHHLLYEFTRSYGEPNVVTTKAVLHKNVLSKLGDLIKADRANMTAWFRNSVIRNNIAGGLQAMQPEDTYKALKDGSRMGLGIEPATMTAIVTLIIAAIAATKDLILTLAQRDAQAIENAGQGVGTESFGPQTTDFEKATSGLLLPLAAGAAAFFFLTRKGGKKTAAKVNGTPKRTKSPNNTPALPATVSGEAEVQKAIEAAPEVPVSVSGRKPKAVTEVAATPAAPAEIAGKKRPSRKLKAVTEVAATPAAPAEIAGKKRPGRKPKAVTEVAATPAAPAEIAGKKRPGRKPKAVTEVAATPAAPAVVAGKRSGRPPKAAVQVAAAPEGL